MLILKSSFIFTTPMGMHTFSVPTFLKRGVVEVIDKESVIRKLTSRRKLRVKHGVDPTTPDLHLGYAAVYEKLRLLQLSGHTIVFIIGDFTGRFGDPTDTSRTRKLRARRDVRETSRSYLTQLSSILDLKKTEVHYNSEWYDRMRAEEFLRLFSHFTVQRMLERDMFKERIRMKREIRLHELLYPALQAYDSVAVRSDLTVVGSDQLFNEMQARALQRAFKQEPQDLITLKMLRGTDGTRKMSQSLGNYIGLTESAHAQYGKIMSLPDSCILPYFELVTRVSERELVRIKKEIRFHPRDAKARLAREVVSIYHGSQKTKEAEEEFDRVFKKHTTPSRIKTMAIKRGDYALPPLLVRLGLAASNTEAKRFIREGAVELDGKTKKDWRDPLRLTRPTLVQVGKKRFLRIRPE